MKVCVQCFNDLELRRFIATNSHEAGKCDYCDIGIDSELLDISELLDFFAEFIGIFKSDPNGIPLVQMIQNDWALFSGEATGYNILSDIILALNSSITNPQETVSYIEDVIECISYWETLKDEIKWRKRFLTNIDKLEELQWHHYLSQTLQLSTSEPLFRTRLHYLSDQKEIDTKEMGCPDKSQTSAGRANPQGIPYLYLSKNIETTLYEVRATFLDEVSVGTFHVKENSTVILVDFSESSGAFSKVDEIVEYTKRMLLKRLISDDLSKPIRRYDSELEYIPTQFICEFIRYITGADGILFNSSLYNGGKNIVLFEQDKVECVSVAKHRVTKVEIGVNKIFS
jgi:hypothetical protein